MAYTNKAGIDLAATGCYNIKDVLKQTEDVEALKSAKAADRWKWKKSVSTPAK